MTEQDNGHICMTSVQGELNKLQSKQPAIEYTPASMDLKLHEDDVESMLMYLKGLIDRLREDCRDIGLINLIAQCLWLCLSNAACHRLHLFQKSLHSLTSTMVTDHKTTFFTGVFDNVEHSKRFLGDFGNCFGLYYDLALDSQRSNEVMPLILGHLTGPRRQIMALIHLGVGNLKLFLSQRISKDKITKHLVVLTVSILVPTHPRILHRLQLDNNMEPIPTIFKKDEADAILEASMKILLEALDHGTTVDYISCTSATDALLIAVTELSSVNSQKVLLTFNQLLSSVSMSTLTSRLIIIVCFQMIAYHGRLKEVPFIFRLVYSSEGNPPFPKSIVFAQPKTELFGIDLKVFHTDFNYLKLWHVLRSLLVFQKCSIENILQPLCNVESSTEAKETRHLTDKVTEEVIRLTVCSQLLIVITAENDMELLHSQTLSNVMSLIAANDLTWTSLVSIYKEVITECPSHTKSLGCLLLDLMKSNAVMEELDDHIKATLNDLVFFSTSSAKPVLLNVTSFEKVYDTSSLQ